MFLQSLSPSPSLLRYLRCVVTSGSPLCFASPRRPHSAYLKSYTTSSFNNDSKSADKSQHEHRTPLRKQLKDEAKVAKSLGSSNKAQIAPDTQRFSEALRKEWELTVGIEIHAELATAYKLFSPATTSLPNSSSQPNSHVSVFDAAFPGTQPNFQIAALLPALRAALALNCEIQHKSSWDRKHYFWWDQPNGYQITQYYEPFAKNGFLNLYQHDDPDPLDLPEEENSITIGIRQVQMEQDTAKTIQQPPSTNLLDLNRVSHPLIEIITLPQIHTPKTAAAVVRKIQSILRAVGANTTGMEMGGLRADVNVSVQHRETGLGRVGHEYSGVRGLGQRVEIKNLSSFKMVEDAVSVEAARQVSVLCSGYSIEGETRRFDGAETKRIRGKEGEVDYRYMPDPDLGPLVIGQDLVSLVQTTLPTIPDETLAQLTDADGIYNLTMKDARTLLMFDDGIRLEYYFNLVHYLKEQLETNAGSNAGVSAGNWILHELGSSLSKRDDPWTVNCIPAPSVLGDILKLLLQNRITMPIARQLLEQALDKATSTTSANEEEYYSDFDAEGEVRSQGLLLEPFSEEEYEALARTVVETNRNLADKVRKGGKKQEGKIMWFVGQMVRIDKEGRVQPERAERSVREVIFAT